jgi:hypothetical protein
MSTVSRPLWQAIWPTLIGGWLLALPQQAQCAGNASAAACLPKQYYSAWERDPAFVATWKCYYFYAVDLPRCRYECQVCYWHNTEGYRHWVYYYNPVTARFWGKCASPSNALFALDKPIWAKSTDNGVSWGPLLLDPPKVPSDPQLAIASPPIPPTP